MNKQEAIERVKEHGTFYSTVFGGTVKMAPIGPIINTISQIHEPQRVVVPKFVAEWIEYAKAENFPLRQALDHWSMSKELEKWFQYSYNQETLARGWLDGYEVEKEQLYVVTDGNKLYLKEFDELNAVIIINDVVGAIDYAKRYSDKTEAQKAADELGWVVKEVE